MRYPTIQYVESSGERRLKLHSFDGTCRIVSFRSDEDMAAAMIPGRAEADCVAIESGLLPRGAVLVSSAGAVDAREVLAEIEETPISDVDPLAAVRLGFSQRLLADRSRLIDEVRDAEVREAYPDKAGRYDLLVDAAERVNANVRLF